jgi:hypothetical protein
MFPETRDTADDIFSVHIQLVYVSWIVLVHVFLKKGRKPVDMRRDGRNPSVSEKFLQ